jgi:hypothetical protein
MAGMERSLTLLIAASACLAGCSRSPTPSPLNFKEIGFVEERMPMPVGMVVENPGTDPVEVDSVTFSLDEHLVLTTASTSPIKRLIIGTALLDENIDADGGASPLAEGTTIKVPPSLDKQLRCMMLWQELNGDEAPMVAVLRGTFVVTHGDNELAHTEPVVLVLPSREGALQAIFDGDGSILASTAAAIRSMVFGHVRKSPAIEQLISVMKERGLLPRN